MLLKSIVNNPGYRLVATVIVGLKPHFLRLSAARIRILPDNKTHTNQENSVM